jgi:5-methylcytosine-specific restriction protein A
MIRELKHKFHLLTSKSREKKKEKNRSSGWKEVRDDFLRKNPTCAACGETENLQVHHIVPFHLKPELELIETNLITLCMNKNECHLEIGHGDSWKCYNPNVKEDAEKHLSDPQHRDFLAEEVKTRRIYMSK